MRARKSRVKLCAVGMRSAILENDLKRGGHFGVLTGMRVFQKITLRRATNSAESQAKIRFAFHFVERNNLDPHIDA